MFIDAGGTDDYRVMGAAATDSRDDQAWTKHETPQDPVVYASEHGTGVDGAGDSTLHAR